MSASVLCFWSNNSLTALVTEQTHEAIQEWNERNISGEDPGTYPGPIFLFDTPGFPKSGPWSLGDTNMMLDLVEAAGSDLVRASISIPFSNGWQLYGTTEAVLEALTCVGTLSDAVQTFGIDLLRLIDSRSQLAAA